MTPHTNTLGERPSNSAEALRWQKASQTEEDRGLTMRTSMDAAPGGWTTQMKIPQSQQIFLKSPTDRGTFFFLIFIFSPEFSFHVHKLTT